MLLGQAGEDYSAGSPIARLRSQGSGSVFGAAA